MEFNLYKTVFKALNGEDWPPYLQIEVRAPKQNLRSLNELDLTFVLKHSGTFQDSAAWCFNVNSTRPSKLAQKLLPFVQETQRKSSQMPWAPVGKSLLLLPRVLLPNNKKYNNAGGGPELDFDPKLLLHHLKEYVWWKVNTPATFHEGWHGLWSYEDSISFLLAHQTYWLW